MAFKKGQSGNPGGRSPRKTADGRTLAEIARTHTESALETLVEVAMSKSENGSARVSAAKELLDRGWGRATQPISGDPEGQPIKTEQKVDISNLPLEVQRMIAKIVL